MALMARRWVDVQNSLQSSIEALAKELAAIKVEGGAVTQAALWRMERYQSLLAQTRVQINKYIEWADATIQAEQRAVGLLAQQSAAGILNAYGVHGAFELLNPLAVEYMVGLLADGSPLKDLLLKAWPDAVEGITKALVDGTALGWNPRKTARAMVDGLDKGLDRMVRIARTEQIRVYRQATMDRYRESGLVTGYIRKSAKQERTCIPCLLLDGTEYTLDEELDDHVNGRCHPGDTLVTGPTAMAASTRNYRGELVTVRTASGAQLTFTPNHPVLTRHGWVAGGLLQEGDYVVSGTFGEDAAPAVDKNDDHMPASIKEIAEAFRLVSAEMPCAAEDFNGDGKGSKVYVVRTNGLLGDSGDAACLQPLIEQRLGGRSMRRSGLSRLGDLASMLKGLRVPSHSFLRDGDASQVLVHGSALGKQAIGGSLASELGASLEQATANCDARHAEGMGQRVLGFSGEIAGGDIADWQTGPGHDGGGNLGRPDSLHRRTIPPEAARSKQGLEPSLGGVESMRGILGALAGNIEIDRVVEVNRTAFSGHVYSLQTREEWYIAADSIAHNGGVRKGIIVHNCFMVPIVRNHEPPKWDSGREWFEGLDEDAQRRMMGDKEFEAWKDGKFELDDMVKRTENATWGPSVGVKSAGELVQ